MTRARDEVTATIVALRRQLDGAGSIASPSAFAAELRARGDRRAPEVRRTGLDFSLMFFSATADDAPGADPYRLVHAAVRFADRAGFRAVWLPERHFHPFGGPYPAPAVLAASLAPVTEKIRLRAGSVVLSLEHPLRVAEAWSVVDNLSGGRVDVAFGSGWNPDDFVLSPATFAAARQVTLDRIDVVRRLWRGESITAPNGQGKPVAVRVYPRPIQPELPVWISTLGRIESFQAAGRAGFNVLTMLLGGTLDELGPKVAAYRAARAEVGLDPAAGIVTLMLHTFVGDDARRVDDAVREPFTRYIRGSLDVQQRGADTIEALTAAQLDQVAACSYERYARTAALIGTPETCAGVLERVVAAGIDEIACLIDFGVAEAQVLASLEHLDALRRRWVGGREDRVAAARVREGAVAGTDGVGGREDRVAAARVREGAVAGTDGVGGREDRVAAARGREGAVVGTDGVGGREDRVAAARVRAGAVAGTDGVGGREDRRDVAVVGLSGRFAGAADVREFWAAIAGGHELLGDPPAGRFPGTDAHGPAWRGGYMADVARFDPRMFKISPAEAAVMDPHHRLTLEAVWAALEDAGLRPGALAGSRTGVFVAFYSNSYGEAAGATGDLDALQVTGRVHALVANRVSFVFDWSGPSEVIDTACSSGLVALHRAVRALRAGECDQAVVVGVSLLLSAAESVGLRRLGVLSAGGRCLAFDRAADGQVRGEGVGAVVLRPLARAEAERDFVYAVVRGTAVNHAGGCSGSLTLPSPRRQAECVTAALADAGLRPRDIGYLEGHGAGSAAGDLAELSAFCEVFAGDPAVAAGACAIGSVKPNIGSLDAAGGIAGLIKAVLCVHHGVVPRLVRTPAPPEEVDGRRGWLEFPAETRPWSSAAPRRAGVHAYGLGGTHAHAVVEAYVADGEAAPGGPARPRTVALSARTEDSLSGARARLAAWLRARPEVGLADVAHTLRVGREVYARRWAAVVADIPALVRALEGAEDAGVVVTCPGGPEVDERAAAARAWVGGGSAELAADADGGRRIPLPGYVFSGRSFPWTSRPDDAVATFYDYASSDELHRFAPTYLTFAPFPEVVPGFSWTRTFADPAHDPGHHALMVRRQEEMRAVLFGAVDFKRVRRCLDFGCGFATDLIVLAQAHPHLSGVGYTVSSRQAEAGQHRIREQGLADRLAVFRRDSAVDPFPGEFELIFGLEVAHHVADKEGLFANIARHLTPGGHLVLADCLTDTVTPVRLPHLGAFTSTKAEYAELFARLGLQILECVDVSPEIANFLRDPHLEDTLARQGEQAAGKGQADRLPLVREFLRAWDNFGEGLRTGVFFYLLITAIRVEPGAADLRRINEIQLAVA